MATPHPPVSLADRPIVTDEVLYHPVEQLGPLQVADGAPGAVVSTCTAWDWTASALPARSVEKNLTLAVLEMANGPL